MKSRKTLNSFIAYCKKNSGLRFWQALSNWSRFSKIVGVIVNSDPRFSEKKEDTFYFEGKDN